MDTVMSKANLKLHTKTFGIIAQNLELSKSLYQ